MAANKKGFTCKWCGSDEVRNQNMGGVIILTVILDLFFTLPLIILFPIWLLNLLFCIVCLLIAPFHFRTHRIVCNNPQCKARYYIKTEKKNKEKENAFI